MLQGKRILIVEDSRTVKLQLKMILGPLGVVLSEAGSEWGTLKKIDEYGFTVDLIIMDLVLKHEDGLKIIEGLKVNERYKNIPIMILSEKAERDTILKARELGIKCFMRKPIRKAELVKNITDLLGDSYSG